MSLIDDVMGFDPTNLSVFNTQSSTVVDDRIYKALPKMSKSEDGNYRSKIRVLYNPHDIKQSIINNQTYWISDEDGGMTVISPLSVGDKSCPIFKGWKKMRYSGAEGSAERTAAEAEAKKLFQRGQANWVLIQIIEDDNQPELVGQFKFWKIPVGLMNKMIAKIKPADTKKMPDPLMDYVFGKVLELEVAPGPDDPKMPQRKEREINYDLSEFDSEVTPIINTDGTSLFNDEEMSIIEEFVAAKKKIAKLAAEKRGPKLVELNSSALGASVKEKIYSKAIEFMKTAPDVTDLGYKPWSEELTARVEKWVSKTLNGETTTPQVTAAPTVSQAVDIFDEVSGESPEDDDLPF